MFNKVILHGNMTRDPELRYTPTGTAVAKFGLAINRKWYDKTTQDIKEEVTFIDVTAFGKSGENVAQYFKKGSQILMEGRLKLDQWEDKQTGQNRSKLGVIMESFTFVGEKRDDAGESGEQGERREAPQATAAAKPEPS